MSIKAVVLRIFLGFILPPMVGALLMSTYAQVASTGIDSSSGFIETFLGITLGAFIFVGIQSLIYAFFMEYLVNRVIESNVRAVLVSMLLGVLAGAIFPSLMFFTIGAVVGLVVGIVLRYAYVKAVP